MAICPKCGVEWYTVYIARCQRECPLRIKVGDRVRVDDPTRKRYVHGLVIGESYEGKCWTIQHGRGISYYHKSYCVRIRRNEASATLRGIEDRSIYGDGDI